MKFQLVSDLHLDFYWKNNEWQSVVNHIIDLNLTEDLEHAEVLIIAGDLAEVKSFAWLNSIKTFSDNYNLVLIVLGNHEHYGSNLNEINKILDKLPSNVKCLDNNTHKINNLIIAGSSLWYSNKISLALANQINDFKCIPNLASWVFDYHNQAIKFLNESNADLIITHNAPHANSIHLNFIGDKLNQFFISDCTDIIDSVQPVYWCHGHTHHPFNYVLNKTNVLANPLAYPKENYKFINQYPPCFFNLTKQ